MAIKQGIADKTNPRGVGVGGGVASGGDNCNTVFLDWLDNSCGLELLGCDESCATASRNVIGSALNIRKTPAIDLQTLDYAGFHDELLESLLFEQTQQQKGGPTNDAILNDSGITLKSENTEASDSSRKRRRPVKLTRRRTPPKIRTGRVSPDPADTDKDSGSYSTITFADLQKADYPEPSFFLHPQCRLQKDKGMGEAVGSNICAKGREACLEKLRAKMSLLAEHALGDSKRKGTAKIKRRKATVSERHANFVETRSLLEMRMGFLSMQYGLLLRWDTGHTGKATLVVLRKMCHESFYPKKPVSALPQSSALQVSPISQRDVVGNKDAILQRPDGTEVTLLEPPYCIKRPQVFAPTVLRVNVVSASGLSQRATWIVQLSYEDSMENFVLQHNSQRSMFFPKTSESLARVIPENEALSFLEIKLFEHRVRRRNQRRLITTMRVPLTGLQPQPSGATIANRVQLSFSHDPDASLQLDFLFRSDYLIWLQQELEARRALREEKTIENVHYEEKDDPWEWLVCCVC